MVDSKALKAQFILKGYTQKDIALKLGIAPRTMSEKLRKGVFGSDEIEAMMVILEIKDPVPIFFTKK